ncbi:MAG: hypothetical protein ACRDRL_12485 [Sciscionella sp.]
MSQGRCGRDVGQVAVGEDSVSLPPYQIARTPAGTGNVTEYSTTDLRSSL